MGFAIATFTAAGQSTRDTSQNNGNNPTTFRDGIVQVMARDLGSFEGTVQLRRAFSRANGTLTAFEVVDAWDETKLPLTREFTYVPGVHFDLHCLSCMAGSVEVSMGRS